jgi:hypothetical protein
MSLITYSRIPEFPASENKILTDGIIEWVTVYFKIAKTDSIIYYNIPLKWSLSYFITIISQWVLSDLNLENRSIQIIPMGQEISGEEPEDCPILSGSLHSYYDKFIKLNKWPSFYIKINRE